MRMEWLALTPRDAILVRDGRQFDAGVGVVAEPTHPNPSTVAGAVFTAYGGVNPEPDEVRGPVLARRERDAWTALLPPPLDLIHPLRDRNAVRRLRPEPPRAQTDLGDGCECWLTGEGDGLAGWLPSRTMTRYLHGELFDADTRERDTADLAVEFQDPKTGPLAREQRVGLALTKDHVADEGFLYQATYLRPDDRVSVSLLAGCALPDSWSRVAQGPVPLGGRGRLADVEKVTGFDWPPPPPAFPEGRVLVYVATPAIWRGGWRIPVPDDARLVAAAVGHPEPIATASPREGMERSRALRWAVPAGSIYLLQFDGNDEGRAASWAAQWHGTGYGREQADRRLRTAGFGVILTGVWT